MGEFVPLSEAGSLAKPFVPVADAAPLETPGAVAEKPPTSSSFSGMEAEHHNVLLGASQNVSPNVSDHAKHLLGELHENDEGKLGYIDKVGKFVPLDVQPAHPSDKKSEFDPLRPAASIAKMGAKAELPEKTAGPSKHIVLKDPEDKKFKVYERSPENEESNMVGLGRVLMQGMGPGALPMAGTPGAAREVMGAVKGLKDATGVEVHVPRTATTDSWVRKGIAKLTSAIPGGSGPMEAKANLMKGSLGEAASATAELPTGVKTSAEGAGETARAAIGAYTAPQKEGGILASKVGKAFDAVDNTMPAKAVHDLQNTRREAQALQSEYEAMKLDEGSNKPFLKTLDKVFGAVTDPQGIDYKSLKGLRTMIGDELGVAKGTEKTHLQRLYRGLSRDMEDMIGTHGGQRGTQLWNRANDYHRLALDRIDKLGKIVGARSDEGIFGRLVTMAGNTTTANAKALALAKKAMAPEEWAEVASGVVGRLGQGEGGFSPSKFLTDYGKLSDRGKAMLFGGKGSLRKSLDNIAKISERWGQQADIAHPSGELPHYITGAGLLHHPMEALKAIFTAKGVSRILSRETTARTAAKFFHEAEQLKFKGFRPASVTSFNNAVRAISAVEAENERRLIGQTAGWAARKGAEYTSKLYDLYKGK